MKTAARAVELDNCATQNAHLDSVEAELRKELGPKIISMTRCFDKPLLEFEVRDEGPVSTDHKKRDMKLVGKKGVSAPPRMADIMRQPVPPPAPSTFERVRNTVEHAVRDLPCVPTVERTNGGVIVGIRVGPGPMNPNALPRK